MTWVETQSLSFTARHDDADADAAQDLLDDLESFRAELAELFERTPGDIAVIVHSRPYELALAQPWLPLARMAASPASRRYMVGWFGRRVSAAARAARAPSAGRLGWVRVAGPAPGVWPVA